MSGCLCREIGLYEKQSSCFFQAKSSRSIVRGNVMFNMVSFLGLERFAYSVFFSFSSREEKEEEDEGKGGFLLIRIYA